VRLSKTGEFLPTDGGIRKNAKLKKYLVFKLNENFYATPLADVMEVIGLPKCVPVPGNPAYLLGMINLRGRVISAIDLKKKLGIATAQQAIKRPAVILTESKETVLGCVVDSITEVLAIDEGNIERSMEVQVHGEREHIQGIARFPDRAMILILNLKTAADVSEIIRLRKTA
jgi:chemotaxis signal transduction protein